MKTKMNLHFAHVSHKLLKFHKELLQAQIAIVEKEDQKKYNPYELLNLSMNDPRFHWLKAFSDIIIEIDIALENKTESDYDPIKLFSKISHLINTDQLNQSGFKKIVSVESSVLISLGNVRKAVHDLDLILKSDSN